VSKPVAPAQKYRCPMHPEIVSDRPGECPICGMDLVAFTPETSAAPSKPAAEATPADKPQAPSGGHEGHGSAGAGAAPAPAGAVPSVMRLGADRARLAGVRSVEATAGKLTQAVRAVGTVAVDETRVRQVTTKVAGYIERLYVNATGQMVVAGQPLFDLYSPELLASQEEYLRARRSAAEFERSTLPEVRRGGTELAEAARRRLELFDVPPEFIERLERTGQVQRTVSFKAPFGGFVTGKNIVAGQRIEPGMELLTVSDLSRVWVIAQVYEAESALARPGRSAVVTLPYDPDVRRTGKVTFVYPTVETETRTLRVRLEFDNARGLLKPGMFVNVELGGTAVSGILVPDSAILDSGTRQLVFVETAPGDYQARDVAVAARSNGQAIVRSGLAAGERVAVSANFLLDSESRLRSAAAGR
jgi:multidrug efflux pump subunit AcrA (membrane-fusion protein)